MNRTIPGLCALLLAGVCVAVTACPANAQTVALEALERQGLSAQQARIRRAVAEVERRRSAYNPSITLASDVALSPGGTLERVAGVDLDPAHEVLV